MPDVCHNWRACCNQHSLDPSHTLQPTWLLEERVEVPKYCLFTSESVNCRNGSKRVFAAISQALQWTKHEFLPARPVTTRAHLHLVLSLSEGAPRNPMRFPSFTCRLWSLLGVGSVCVSGEVVVVVVVRTGVYDNHVCP